MLFKNISYADENFEVKTGDILVEGNKIISVGESLPESHTGEVYDGKNKLLLPGFYNVHCHVPMVLLRGYGEGLSLDRWLNEKIFPFESKLGAEAIYWGSLLGIAEMIKSGAASFTEMYYFIDTIARAVDLSGMKANIGNGVISFSDIKYAQTKEYRETQALREFIRGLGHDRIVCDASVHAEYTSGPEIVREVAEFAKENSLGIHVHISETKREHEGSKERRGGLTPTQYFAECGLFDVPVTAAHCVFVEDADMDILLEKGVTVAHCPSSNLKLGSGVAPAWKLLQKGVNVGIGTDGASSNNNLNVLEEITLASLVQKGVNGDPMCMDTASTLKMASQNGARSQGRLDCGVIKAGNRADLIVFDMDKPHLQPVFEPLANILYSAQANDICLNMVDGRVLYKNGELLTIDIEKVMAECDLALKNVLSQL